MMQSSVTQYICFYLFFCLHLAAEAQAFNAKKIITPSVAASDTPYIIDLAPGFGVWKENDFASNESGWLLAAVLLSPSPKLQGITLSSGDVPMEQERKVIFRLFKSFGIEAPVFLGNTQVQKNLSIAEVSPAVDFIAQQLKEQPLHLIVLGSMTNVSSLLINYPFLKSQIRSIVTIAESLSQQATHWKNDPLATETVLSSGLPLVILDRSRLAAITIKKQELLALMPELSWKGKVFIETVLESTVSETGTLDFWHTLAFLYLSSPEAFQCQDQQRDLTGRPGRAPVKYRYCDQINQKMTDDFNKFILNRLKINLAQKK